MKHLILFFCLVFLIQCQDESFPVFGISINGEPMPEFVGQPFLFDSLLVKQYRCGNSIRLTITDASEKDYNVLLNGKPGKALKGNENADVKLTQRGLNTIQICRKEYCKVAYVNCWDQKLKDQYGISNKLVDAELIEEIPSPAKASASLTNSSSKPNIQKPSKINFGVLTKGPYYKGQKVSFQIIGAFEKEHNLTWFFGGKSKVKAVSKTMAAKFNDAGNIQIKLCDSKGVCASKYIQILNR